MRQRLAMQSIRGADEQSPAVAEKCSIRSDAPGSSGQIGKDHDIEFKAFGLVDREQSYNLIFLALKENTIDGLRVLKGLRRAGCTTPIVLFMPSRELEQRRAELSRYPNVLACLAKPLDLRQVDKVMEFLRHPPALKPKDKAKLLQVLGRIEQAVSADA